MQLTDKKTLLIAVLAIAIGIGIYALPQYNGLLLIASLAVFGTLTALWKEPNYKIAGLGALVFLSLLNVGVNGLKFGIDFSGGTRIPVLLEKPVDQATMSDLVQIIKARASILGLSELKVRAVGDSQIYIETPSSDPEQIKFIEDVLSRQGVYTGVVDGKIAIAGENIYSNSIRSINPQQVNADWAVGFSVNKEGGETFAKVVKGKGNYPLYMFLDRPNQAVIFLTKAQLRANAPAEITDSELLKSINDSLRLEGNNIDLLFIEEINLTSEQNLTNKSRIIISSEASQEVKDLAKKTGLKVEEKPVEDMKPVILNIQSGKYQVGEWKAIGLLSSPFLAPSVAEGIPSYNYLISGRVQSTGNAKIKEIQESVKRIESTLKGGSLPVQISLGSRTTLPANLGREFLNLSLIGIVISLILISVFIGLRYQRFSVVIPIILISISELVILLSLLGSFTIDLAAVAGIIAAIGVGVDAQIVITDEVLKKEVAKLEERAEYAFSIIKTNAIVAIIAMVPLLFAGKELVEVIGFAISTMLGALLGYLLSRPAYAFVVEKIAGKA